MWLQRESKERRQSPSQAKYGVNMKFTKKQNKTQRTSTLCVTVTRSNSDLILHYFELYRDNLIYFLLNKFVLIAVVVRPDKCNIVRTNRIGGQHFKMLPKVYKPKYILCTLWFLLLDKREIHSCFSCSAISNSMFVTCLFSMLLGQRGELWCTAQHFLLCKEYHWLRSCL